MFPSGWRKLLRRSFPASPPGRRRPRAVRPQCEALEDRSLPSVSPFTFSTGNPDGKIATASRPANGAAFEIESADDFILNTETQIDSATFTGLVPSGATINQVIVEIYRVFPKDSDVSRTSGPPTFSTSQVPTRVNSPSDVAFIVRDSTAGELSFSTTPLNGSFMAQNSVQPGGIHPKPNQTTGGDGPVTGAEVQFNVSFPAQDILDLPADHYFFVPQVLLSTGNFFWLSAPKPIVAPGTPFTPDLQSWTRDANLDPDWLRIGTDIVGGTTFNGTFSLSGQTITPQVTSLSQTSAVEGSQGFDLLVNGNDFTNFSTVLFNGIPLATTFVSATQLKATVPASFLTDEGTANVGVADAQRGLSNRLTFTILDNVPTAAATLTQDRSLRGATINLTFSDSTIEGHRAVVDWGDGTMSTVNLGVSAGGTVPIFHRYRRNQPGSRLITIMVLDDEGTSSIPLVLTIRFRRRGHGASSRHAAG